MKAFSKAVETGIALGVAAVVAVGLFIGLAGRKSAPLDAALKPEPVDPAVVAPAQKLGDAFAMIAAHVKPAVVSVFSEKTVTMQNSPTPNPFGDDFFRQFFGDQGAPSLPNNPQPYKEEQRGMGSGMIIDKQGHILTNYHVVEGEDHLQVQLADKEQYDATVLSTDPKADMAIVQLKGGFPKDLPTVQSVRCRIGPPSLSLPANNNPAFQHE